MRIKIFILAMSIDIIGLNAFSYQNNLLCQSLFAIKYTESELDTIIQELYDMRVELLHGTSRSGLIAYVYKKKYTELSKIIPESELKDRMRSVKKPYKFEKPKKIKSPGQKILKMLEHNEKILKDFFEETGLNMNSVDYEGNSILQIAARKERLDIVNLLLERGADPNKLNNSLMSVLIYVTGHGKIDFMQALLEHGADPNIPSHMGTTPLMKAATINNLAAAELLLQYGANATLEGYDGHTALYWAHFRKASKELIRLLEQAENNQQKSPSKN